MDEVEFHRALKTLKVLVNDVSDASTRNALSVVVHLLHDLNERVNAIGSDDDE